MNVKDFDSKYKSKGGMAKLTELRSLLFTHAYIGSHFGVTKERAKQWLVLFFGAEYDPREDRKEAIIENMIDFARNNSKEDFRFAFRRMEYYNEALQECAKKGIYDIK